MPALLQHLKERKIVQWAIAYLAGSWVLIEVTSVLAEPFGLAVDPTTRALTVFLAWGFVGALVIAWFHAEKGRQSVTVLELALLALIGAGGVSTAVVSYRMGDLGSPVAAASGHLESVLQGPVVAVLPFVNASEAAEGAAFLASGIHGEVLTHLSKLSGINAISRTSVTSYQATDRSLRQIAQDLGATAILEGTVQRAGSLIRINVSLIDAVRDVQLWGEIYEKVLEPESVFAVQAEIATRIAEALAVALAPEEQSRLTRVPTTDPQAFELYLIGQEAEQRAHRGEFDLYQVAYDHYRDALERDPDYAEVHAAIAGVESRLYGISRSEERTPEQVERVRTSAERAIELDPELAHAHLVLGNYYMGHMHDAVRAKESFLRARRFDPDNVLALRGLAQINMRQGDWDAARADVRRGSDLDPREPMIQVLAPSPAVGSHEAFVRRGVRAELGEVGYPTPPLRVPGR
jgi:TolB-like protein